MYNDILMNHFMNPRHAGKLPDANGVGSVGDPGCGDFMRFFVRISGDVIEDISFLCKGCPAAIASGSATAELALGRTLKEAVYITEDVVSDHLGGMPGDKLHCSNLGVTALRYAIADHLGIRKDGGTSQTPVIERLRSAAQTIARDENLTSMPLHVDIRSLPPEAAIGNTSERDYPIWKGKEGMVEARFLDGIGQAFTPVPADFEGDLGDVLSLDLQGDDDDAHRRRGIFVSAVNALCSHMGITGKTVHCREEGPRECARDLVNVIGAGSPEDSRIALIGCQPRMIEMLSPAYLLRVVDLDPENIGTRINGTIIEGDDATEDVLAWCNIALVTGSTLVKGTIDRFLNRECHTVFYGVTIAGAASLLQLPHFCTRSLGRDD